MRKLDYQAEIDRISAFLRDYSAHSGFGRYIIGVSGGIDSALSAALAVQALGSERVIGVLLPYRDSHPDSTAHGRLLCQTLGIQTLLVDISPMVDAYFEQLEPDADPLRRGNFMARMRMSVLFDLSAKHSALVVGTSNQSELMTGYFTQYGDSAAAIEPIGQLYKTEVWEMARHLNIPECIINKAPTADLWQDQTDEAEMGIEYRILDAILYAIKQGSSLDSFAPEKVKKVQELIRRSEFKRLNPPMPEAPCSI
ncbi:MAG TPA: NAD+ synthase [Candidatus Cloacimonadota bacterium]|nr:NAD+ synthase [Candidatus Cloacimonadota bacterium]